MGRAQALTDFRSRLCGKRSGAVLRVDHAESDGHGSLARAPSSTRSRQPEGWLRSVVDFPTTKRLSAQQGVEFWRTDAGRSGQGKDWGVRKPARQSRRARPGRREPGQQESRPNKGRRFECATMGAKRRAKGEGRRAKGEGEGGRAEGRRHTAKANDMGAEAKGQPRSLGAAGGTRVSRETSDSLAPSSMASPPCDVLDLAPAGMVVVSPDKGPSRDSGCGEGTSRLIASKGSKLWVSKQTELIPGV